MLIVIFHIFMQILLSNLYLPYAPKHHELHFVSETVFPESYFSQKKTLRKGQLKTQANTIKMRFPFHFIFLLGPIVIYC